MTDLHYLPLSERLKKAEYYARELSEHLRQSYLPKLGDLRSSSKQFDESLVSDQQMLDRMLAVLQADEFAQDVYRKLTAYLTSIQKETAALLSVPGDSDDDE